MIQKKLFYGASSVGMFVLSALSVFAAADVDIASTTEALTTSVKDNILGVLTGSTGTMLVTIAAIPITIYAVYKLVRRFLGR